MQITSAIFWMFELIIYMFYLFGIEQRKEKQQHNFLPYLPKIVFNKNALRNEIDF